MIPIYQILVSGSVLGLFLQAAPISFLVAAVYAVYRWVKIRRKGLSVAWGTEVVRWLFVAYVAGLINLILTPNNFWSGIWARLFVGYSGNEIDWFCGEFNWMPTLLKCLRGELTIGSWVKTMLVGNFLMFIPMGIFLPLISPKVNWCSVLKFAVGIPIVVELIQPIVGRSFDVDDILCNVLGILAGFGVYMLIRFLFCRFVKRHG